MSEKKDYFDYVENVLGVKSLLIKPAGGRQSIPLLIAIENYSGYNSAEKDLLAKMISALKIDLQRIHVVDLALRENHNFDFSLVLLDSPDQNTANDLKSITSYSPRILLQNSEFKKKAWSDLQKVMAHKF